MWWIDVVNWDKTYKQPVGAGYDRRRMPITALVLHSTNGHKGSSLDAEARYLQEAPDKGINWLVGKEGGIVEICAPHFAAWHAGASSYQGLRDWNGFSLGVECHHAIGDPWPTQQLDALRWLVQRQMRHFGLSRSLIVCHRWIAIPAGRRTDPDDRTDAEWRAWIAAL